MAVVIKVRTPLFQGKKNEEKTVGIYGTGFFGFFFLVCVHFVRIFGFHCGCICIAGCVFFGVGLSVMDIVWKVRLIGYCSKILLKSITSKRD